MHVFQLGSSNQNLYEIDDPDGDMLLGGPYCPMTRPRTCFSSGASGPESFADLPHVRKVKKMSRFSFSNCLPFS